MSDIPCEDSEEEIGMVCVDYLTEDLRCQRGIPVTERFGSFFCEERREECPFIIWEKSLPRDVSVLRPKSLRNIWRKP